MSEPTHATTLRISHSTEDELNRKLTAIMHARGFVVSRAAPERISVGELAKRVNRRVSTVCRSLRRQNCPPFESRKGKRRTLWIEPNERLISYLTNPSPGGRPTQESDQPEPA